MPAVMWRMGRVEHFDDDPALRRRLDRLDQIVVTRGVHKEPRAHHVMERHGVVFLDGDRPVDAAV